MLNSSTIESGLTKEPEPIGNEKAPSAPSLGLQKQATGGTMDELVQFFKNHWAAVENFQWSSTMQPGTILYQAPISPLKTYGLFEKYTEFYNTWGGSVNYRISLVGTAFYGGKLGMTWIPPNLNVDDYRSVTDLTIFPYEVCDVKETDTIEIKTGDQNDKKYHIFDRKSSAPFSKENIGGTFIIFVMNQLLAQPNSTSVTVQLYINCRDMHLAQIIPSVGTSNASLPSLKITLNSSIGVGDFYSSLILFEKAAMPEAIKFTGGVRKGDGSLYSLPGFSMNGRKAMATTNSDSTHLSVDANDCTIPRTYFRLTNPTQPFITTDSTITVSKVFKPSHLDTTSPNNWHFNGANSTNEQETYNTSLPFGGYGLYEAGISANDPKPFVPKGPAPESIIGFLGITPFVPADVPPLIHAFYYQVNSLALTPQVEGQCYFGQFFDAETNLPLGYYKAYFEGFMTTSAQGTTKIISRPIIFKTIALVDDGYPMPMASLEQQLALQQNVHARRYTKENSKLHKWHSQQLSQEYLMLSGL